MHTELKSRLSALRAADATGVSVVPGTTVGEWRVAAEPFSTLVIPLEEAGALASLPDRVRDWLARDARLVTGAIAYEAAGPLHGMACRRSDGPMAVIHAYRQFEHCHEQAGSSNQDLPPWRLTGDFRADMDRGDYLNRLESIRHYLAAGDCYQVNLAQRLTTHYQGDPLSGWLRLMTAHAAPFAGYLEWEGGALLSASPERFLRVEGRRARTEPIKGTRPRAREPEEDRRLGAELLNSAKDRAENLMIVDLLRNDLGAICRQGSIRVPELFALRRFSNVQHLVSTVTGELNDNVTPLQALLACFPGGSITGAPKRRAMEIIAELEPCARGFYCGALFWQTGPEDFDSSILIRTLQAGADGSLHCHGGGGIVMDSDPEAEYEESLFKVRALMEAMGAGR